MDAYVRRNPDRPRFELVQGDEVVGVADFREVGDTLFFHHTEIARSMRGQRMGERLVKGALDLVRADTERTRKVVAQCWFVAEFLELHPEYADLVA
jgi:uncharacterized protein